MEISGTPEFSTWIGVMNFRLRGYTKKTLHWNARKQPRFWLQAVCAAMLGRGATAKVDVSAKGSRVTTGLNFAGFSMIQPSSPAGDPQKILDM